MKGLITKLGLIGLGLLASSCVNTSTGISTEYGRFSCRNVDYSNKYEVENGNKKAGGHMKNERGWDVYWQNMPFEEARIVLETCKKELDILNKK